MQRSNEKVVIVTGASQGIGAGLVAGYRKAGWNVVANSRSIKADAYGSDHGILVVEGDVGLPGTAERLVAGALETFGRLDSLINNAGIFTAKPFTDFTEEDFAANMAVNVAGFFRTTQRVVAQMLDATGGHIVSITTTLVDQPMAGVPSVIASLTKGGIDAATRSLAIEYATSGIRANAVSPGIIDTPMHPADQHDALASLHPMQRLGTVQDIVDAVLYLENARFITGETIHVDGGQHAGRW